MKASRLDVKELTVFIKVKTDNLNASSLSMPEIVNNNDKIDNDKMKIITDKKPIIQHVFIAKKSKK